MNYKFSPWNHNPITTVLHMNCVNDIIKEGKSKQASLRGLYTIKLQWWMMGLLGRGTHWLMVKVKAKSIDRFVSIVVLKTASTLYPESPRFNNVIHIYSIFCKLNINDHFYTMKNTMLVLWLQIEYLMLLHHY